MINLATSPHGLADVMSAQKVLSRYLEPSPLLEAPILSRELGCRVFLKLDCMLPTGAFKVRGGLHLLHCMTPKVRSKGIVAATRGNHGQSLAYACQLFDAPCRLYVPHGNSPLKNAAMRRLGAELIEHGHDFDAACEAAETYADNTGASYVHPAEPPAVLAGVGTWALEALSQIDVQPNAVFIPVGAGSCLVGAIPVFESLSPQTKIVGVTAESAPAMVESMQSKCVTSASVNETLADGLAVRRPHQQTLDRLLDAKVELVAVTEREIQKAIRDLLLGEQLVAEGSAATTLAAARSFVQENQPDSILLAITGRNIDPDKLKTCLNSAEPARRFFVAT